VQLERSTIDAMAASPCPGPAAPFATWPKHWRQSTGFAWYTQPAVLVTQAAHAHATVEAAVNAINVINFVLAKREADISAAGGLLILHDWRLVTSWDADARRHLMNRARTHDKRLVRGVLVAMTVNPILGACLQTACMLYSLGRKHMEIVRDVPAALLKYQIVAPRLLSPDLRELPSL